MTNNTMKRLIKLLGKFQLYSFSLIIFGFHQWNYDTASVVKQVDSIRNSMNSESYLDRQLQISMYLRNIYPDSTIKYLTALEKKGGLNAKQINKLNHNISIAYFNKSEFELAFFYASKVKEYKDDKKQRQEYIMSLILRFEILNINLEYDSALVVGHKILRIRGIDDQSKFRILNKIAAYYAENQQNEEAIKTYNEIKAYTIKIKDNYWLSEIYLNMANIYQGLNSDSLEYYGWKCIEVAEKCKAFNNQVYSYMVLAQNELEVKGDEKKYNEYMRIAENIARKEGMKQEIALIYYIKLEMEISQNSYNNVHKLTSIMNSLNIFLEDEAVLSLRISCYSRMIEVYERIGDVDNALSISNKLLDHYKKRYNEKTRSSLESFYKINQLYENQERLHDAEKLLISKQKNIYYLLITLFILITFIVFIYSKYSITRTKTSAVLKIKTIEEKELENKFQMLNQYQTDIALLNSKHVEKLRNLKRQISSLKESFGDEFLEKFKDIEETISSTVSSDSVKLSEHFNNIYPEFTRSLMSLNSELTPNDIKICMMIKLNMSTKEMADVLSQSVRTIESTRYRLRRKLKLDSKENLGNFLMNL